MASSTSLTTSKGFTLIEMLIVIGIVALVLLLPMFIDINSFRGDAFRSEQSSLGKSLQEARANSLNNINQKQHGVALYPPGFEGYVIFEGNSFLTRDPLKDEKVESTYKVSFSPATPTEIVFDQLSGDANYDGDITLIDPERGMTAIISINHEGKISW